MRSRGRRPPETDRRTEATCLRPEPKKGTKEEIAILEEVLKVAPNDSAAHHYWIHAMEPSAHPERAVESATMLASLAPASGHMVHMPGHIFYRTGDYETARVSFEDSMHVENCPR